LFDNEIGRTQNYLAKPGIVHSEIMLPVRAPNRWRDRETLWNEVTAGEVRIGAQRKSQLAREIEIALPRAQPGRSDPAGAGFCPRAIRHPRHSRRFEPALGRGRSPARCSVSLRRSIATLWLPAPVWMH
jgi:hypothetical protein